jgi:hypothetical protein
LGEREKTVTYKFTHRTAAGELITYAHYSIVAQEGGGYWLQRVATMQPESAPLSITQSLLDDYTHEPIRYIMHRPAKMDQPENIIDLPLSKMGQDEILPTPVTGAFTEEERLQLASGTFDTKKGWNGKATLWVNLDIPVLGVVKAEMEEWTMELFQISDAAEDLLPQKPPQGGIVYLNK